VSYQHYNHRLAISFVALIILNGCAPQIRIPVTVYPGKESVADSVSILRSRSQNVPPLKANGRCRLQYYTDGKKHKENFPVKLWVNPPSEIYMQGDIAFDPKGLIAGSNETEFWLAIKPKEINSYWWGQWTEGTSTGKLLLSPKIVLDTLGIVEIGSEENWSLSNEGVFDVLTKRNEQATIIKKIHIYNSRDYLIKKIEYFNADGQAAVIAELDKYKEVLKDFLVPTSVKIINRADGEEDSVRITLGSIKSISFSDEQRRRLFIRPQPRGFKNIYKIVDNNTVEQP